MVQPRILTFNFHEPYLCLLAKTGLVFDIGLYSGGPLARDWHTHYRPKPINLNLVAEAVWRRDLEQGNYGVVLAQNEMNALDILQAPCPKLLLCHNRKTFLGTSASLGKGDPAQEMNNLLEVLAQSMQFVYISDSKARDYGIPGAIIPPGIDVEDYGGYQGDQAMVLRVGNTMRERNLMFDVPFQEQVCSGLPNRIIGYNPSIPGSEEAPSFDALLDLYRRVRCLLHVTRKEYEDGYNLSMLEAMACGQPVVALDNWTTPLTDGIDGFVSYEPTVLHRRLRELLEDREQARAIGAAGRETVARLFPMETFVKRWREVLFAAAEGKTRTPVVLPPQQAPTKVLLDFIHSPLTTGRYIEAALQPLCDVLTVGFRLPEAVLEHWEFEEKPPPYRQQQIPIEIMTPYATMLKKLPQNYAPDLYFYVDSGPHEMPPGLELLRAPKVAYIIDSHVSPELRLAMARQFDYVFMAQKGQLEAFREGGVERANWLPLACWPSLHDVGLLDRTYDVSYVGSFNKEEVPRRRELLAGLKACFPQCYFGKAWPEDMARIYASSKIVVNACHNRDVNMRVFEALASGALLVTDEADGLEDLFEDGRHLVIYRQDNDVVSIIEYYLAHETERRRIAEEGQRLVLERHTYRHRMEELLESVSRGEAARKLETVATTEPKHQLYYQHPRRELLPLVPLKTRRLLDVGCGAGVLGALLKSERRLEEVAGIEVVEQAYEQARLVLDTVLLGNIEEMELPFDDGYFDCIICADVLEHLIDPAAALRKLKRVLEPEGVLIISIPNIRFHEVPAMLSHGAWTYTSEGIMDATHLRFFTKTDLRLLVEDAGLEVARLGPISMAPPARLPRTEDGSVTLGKLVLHEVSDEEYEDLRTYQYFVAACIPGIDRLASAREALKEKLCDRAFFLAADATGVDETERRLIMARAKAQAGDLATAEQIYRECLEKEESAEACAEYGLLLVSLGRPADAARFLERAIARDPHHHAAQGALGLVRLQAGESEQAYALIAASLDGDIENRSLIRPLVSLTVELGKQRESEPLLRRYIEFYPGDLSVACDYARLLLSSGRVEEARERLETVLLFDADHREARRLIETIPER